jgi:hypothetical protein
VRAASHVDDHALVFVDLHYLMALAARGTPSAVSGFLRRATSSRRAGKGTEADVMADVGLPLARAVVAHRAGDYGAVVDSCSR